MKAEELLFDWDCYPQWYTFARIIEAFIMDAFVDLIITLCIVINTIFMAMETANMSPEMANFLTAGNYVSLRYYVYFKLYRVYQVYRERHIEYATKYKRF